MRSSQYVVSGRDSEWEVRRANSRVTGTFQAKHKLCVQLSSCLKKMVRAAMRPKCCSTRMIASSRDGSTAKTCIPTTQQDPLAKSSQDEAAPNLADRTLRNGDVPTGATLQKLSRRAGHD
jgi:hypothetical protein